MNKDTQSINEAYDNMPPQCPPHLLEEGMSHRLHSWVMGKALPWLQKNKGKVAVAGGLAAALVMYLGMDPDTAQQAVDGLDPETRQGLEIDGEIRKFRGNEMFPVDSDIKINPDGSKEVLRRTTHGD